MKDKQKSQKNHIPCPECDTLIKVPKKLKVGMILECPSCGTESEFLGNNPFNLAPLEEEK